GPNLVGATRLASFESLCAKPSVENATMGLPHARRRLAFNIQLSLQTLEDRLPPGQATQLATGALAVVGATAANWDIIDRDPVAIGGFAGGLDSRAITGVNEASPFANGHTPLQDPVQLVTEYASSADATTQSESNSEVSKQEGLEGIVTLDPAAAADDAGANGAADFATGSTVGGNYGGMSATGSPPLATPSTSSASGARGQAPGTDTGAPSSPAFGTIPTKAPAGPVLTSAQPGSGKFAVAYTPPATDTAAAAQLLRVTVRNRNSDTMSGGWNPALRSI